MKKSTLIIASLSALLLLTGCGQSPEKAYQDIANDAGKGNWEKVYDSFSLKSQGQLDMSLKMMAGMAAAFSEEGDADAERIQNMSGKEVFVLMMEGEESDGGPVLIGEVISTEIDGDRATLRIQQDENEEEMQLVKENGKWKLLLEMD